MKVLLKNGVGSQEDEQLVLKKTHFDFGIVPSSISFFFLLRAHFYVWNITKFDFCFCLLEDPLHVRNVPSLMSFSSS